ncbi:MAG: sulfurtransferase [Spirochaetales bacterium]|nr:sulfurtransferase [Spirochaetales bacterium]
MKKRLLSDALIIMISVVLLLSCGNGDYAESGMLIINADDAAELAATGSWILVDAQKSTSFEKEHVEAAVNIERAQITVKKQVANMLASPESISAAAGMAGITAESDIIIYDDNNNMDSGRLAWTFMIYGHKGQIKVVSGGLSALKAEGVKIIKGKASAKTVVYKPGNLDSSMIIDKEEVLKLLDNPLENCVIIDVRSDEEYNAGTIPGAVHVEYLNNDFSDFTYKPVQQIRILYKDKNIMPEDTVVMFCKSSIRAAQSWIALYNAGYRNLKIYDGAWLEWSADDSLPVFVPEVPGEVRIEVQDAS